jgi:hypothetical protein
MRGKPVTGSWFRGKASSEHVQEALLERRRRYNRRYMRHWRANLAHEALEREKRRQWYYERKAREAWEKLPPFTNNRGEPVCGFCWKRPPVTQILRLRISENGPHGYVQVRIPYCGQC